MERVFRRSIAAVAGSALALAVGIAGSSPALAACTPAAADGVTATCSGTTINQGVGAPGTSAGIQGYGVGQNNVTVNVLPGATVTGTNSGIFLNNNAVIHNSGSITGIGGSGITAATLTSLVNSGSITGADRGISTLSITSLVNSGLISGTIFAIFKFSADPSTLTLLPGSVLVGQVSLGGGVNTLNVGKGLSMATTFVGAAPVIGSMSVPFVVNGTQVVTADTTSFANHSTAIADLTGGIFSSIQNRIDHLRGGVSSFAQPMFSSYAADVSANAGPWTGFGSGGGADRSRQVWMQAFGSYRQQEGTSTTLDSQQRLGGFVSGMDAALSATARAGVFVGASMSAAQADFNAGRTDADSFFGGVYSSTQMGRGFVDLAFTAGYSSFDRERRIANNQVASGIETAKADYHGWFVSPEVRFVQPAGALEGSLTLRYAGLFLDGFNESGVTAGAMTVGIQDIHLGIARAALSLPLTKSYSDGAVARWVLTGGVEGRTQFGGDSFSGTLQGQGIAFSAGGRDSTVGLFGSYRAELASPLGHTVFAAVEGLVEQDGSYQLTGKAGFRVRY